MTTQQQETNAILNMSKRLKNVEQALELSLLIIDQHEPIPVSSFCNSNEFVALASVLAKCEDENCMNWIKERLKGEFPNLNIPTEVTVSRF